MKVASGFASGPQAARALAEQAVGNALASAGLSQASQVLLLLSRELARDAGDAVRAAARTAGCLQVAGSTASGLLTEAGWLLDQPAAAALVLGDTPASMAAPAAPVLCFSGRPTLPAEWQAGEPRTGLLEADAVTWSNGRVSTTGGDFRLSGSRGTPLVASGQRLLEGGLTVDTSSAYELRRVAGLSAVASLRRALPADIRDTLPLHRLSVIRDADGPPVAILAAHADGSMTLAVPLSEGERIAWAIRQPLAAEEEMRRLLANAGEPPPDFALMFSCIGRGPLFYGDEDLDLLAFRRQFPGVPLLGAYGGGQIAPTPAGNRLFHNTAVTVLYRSHHV